MLSRRELANAIRALSMDAVEKANSGHPGAPMGMADMAEVLWNDFLRHNPGNPRWIDRDRFVMSNGHGSMLLYSLLHLTGYDLSLDEIRNFRQLHSKTPGHPEYGHTPGVETTTGPLGQGLANAVGMAIAEKNLAGEFNREGFDIINHFTYVTVGDGCLMEGISHEASSLAGTLRLGKLICLFDSNQVSIDGDVRGWFTEDTARRFEAYGWHVIKNVDGHDPEQVKRALRKARRVTDKPSFIVCHTVIGWGAPNKQGKASCHGSALGKEEVALVRKQIGWPYDPFVIPDEYYSAWDARRRGKRLERKWQKKFEAYRQQYPDLAAAFGRRINGELPANWDDTASAFIHRCAEKAENIATRKASQNALEAYGPVLPELIGGSADLTGSNLTRWSGSKVISGESGPGNYIFFGVREFGMAAINSGIALHGGYIPYGGTFLIFSEYARNALRVAALMKVHNIFVFTHDSIGLGEDGPTHQAVEQAATLRLIPNMSVWRPCDTVESAVAWKTAIERNTGPTSLLFSRQNLKQIPRSGEQIKNINRGGYVLVEGGTTPEIIIIATGSEVELAFNVTQRLNGQGHRIRLVSMPSTDVFDAQDAAWRDQVLPPHCRKRIAVEAGIGDYWRKYVGLDGKTLGVNTFGQSAPGPDVYEYFGLTEAGLTDLVKSFL
jgi:transketolase